MKILLDTNFLLTCAKQKIDFVELIGDMVNEEASWIIPVEVFGELKDLSTRKDASGKDKDAAKLALLLIERMKYESIKLNNKNVDQGILDFVKGKGVVLATMDKKLKDRFGGKILTIKDMKMLEFVY